jgi:hypothetical protein
MHTNTHELRYCTELAPASAMRMTSVLKRVVLHAL